MTSFADDPAAAVPHPPPVTAGSVELKNDASIREILMGNGESHMEEDSTESDDEMVDYHPDDTSQPKRKKKKKKKKLRSELTPEELQDLEELEELERLAAITRAMPDDPPEEPKKKSPKQKRKSAKDDTPTAPKPSAPVLESAQTEVLPAEEAENDPQTVETVAKPEKKKRKKKNRQTSQEEESAQALLALNKGVSTGENEQTIENDEGRNVTIAAEETKTTSKKKRGKSKRVLSKEVVTQEDDNLGLRDAVPNIDENVETAEAALNQVMAAESLAIDHTTRSRESADLPESQRIISEHLAAHLSKIPPPPAQPQQAHPNIEQRLTTQLQQNGFQAPLVTTDTTQGFVSINPNNEPPPMPRTSKRKRGAADNSAAVANQALMVDPQLMQLDQEAALALGAAGEGNSGKARKRRKAAADQVVSYVPTLQDNVVKTPRRIESNKSNWGTATPNPGESVNGGTFDLEERHAIDKALADYGTAHGMTIMELRDRVWGNNRKKDEFWNEICRAVPNRSRASVYKHVRRSCHIFEQRAKWTEPEDNQLAALVAEKGNKWKEIGLAMDRMGEDCRDRYRNYVKCGKDRGTDRWSAEEEELLKQTVANQMEQSREQLRREGKPVPQDKEGELTLINWTVISDLMDNRRSRIQCRYKWKKMIAQKERVQRAPIGVTYEGGKRKRIAFDTQQMLPGDKYWLTLQVRNSGVTQESEIPWDTIAKNDTEVGIWTHKDLKAAFKQFRSHLPYRRRPLSEIIREMLVECESLTEDHRNTRFVPNTNEEDGVQDVRTVSSYSPSAAGTHRSPPQGNFEIPIFTTAPDQPSNVAPVASMAGIPTMHQDPNLALDPSLAGMEELEKTAGEAIAYSAGLEAAARVARSVVGAGSSNNHEDDNELRERLGSFLKTTTPGP